MHLYTVAIWLVDQKSFGRRTSTTIIFLVIPLAVFLDRKFNQIFIGGKIKILSENINYFTKIYTLNYLEVNGNLCVGINV